MSETLVVTDLDGTFWDDQMCCHSATLEAVAVLEARNIPLLVATGRRAASAKVGLTSNGLNLPSVLLNGALGIDFPNDRDFHRQSFTAAAATDVVRALSDIGLSPVMYLADGTVRGRSDATTGQAHLEHLGAEYVVAEPENAAEEHEILGFSMIGLTRPELEPVLEAVPANAAGTDLYQHSLQDAWSIHIQPLGLSKWDGVQAYLAYSGLTPRRVVALGDHTNDLEMLRMADVALGVDGGHDDALALADQVIPHPREGGWAEVLDHLSP